MPTKLTELLRFSIAKSDRGHNNRKPHDAAPLSANHTGSCRSLAAPPPTTTLLPLPRLRADAALLVTTVLLHRWPSHGRAPPCPEAAAQSRAGQPARGRPSASRASPLHHPSSSTDPPLAAVRGTPPCRSRFPHPASLHDVRPWPPPPPFTTVAVASSHPDRGRAACAPPRHPLANSRPQPLNSRRAAPSPTGRCRRLAPPVHATPRRTTTLRPCASLQFAPPPRRLGVPPATRLTATPPPLGATFQAALPSRTRAPPISRTCTAVRPPRTPGAPPTANAIHAINPSGQGEEKRPLMIQGGEEQELPATRSRRSMLGVPREERKKIIFYLIVACNNHLYSDLRSKARVCK